MTDLKIVYTDGELLEGDLSFQSNDIEMDEGLATSVLLSIFTDRRAKDDDLLPDSLNRDRKGFWGDLLNEDSFELGSRLWLLQRSKITNENQIRAEQYIRESLQWLLDDNIAASITVSTQVNSHKVLLIDVQIRRSDSIQKTLFFNLEWSNTL